MIELTYRCREWPFERPDVRETLHESEVQEAVDSIKAEGGHITGQRDVSWQEALAQMENSHEL